MNAAAVILPGPVILNSFQDPSCRDFGLLRGKVNRAVCAVLAPTDQAEKWILKQVQDDEACEKALPT